MFVGDDSTWEACWYWEVSIVWAWAFVVRVVGVVAMAVAADGGHSLVVPPPLVHWVDSVPLERAV